MTTTTSVLTFPASRSAAPAVCTLAPGAAIRFTPRAPTALRIAEGRAWVTLDDGIDGARGEAAGDVFLQAGQTLWVAAGQCAVVESLDGKRLQYRWTAPQGSAARRPSASWWQRLRGNGRTAGATPGDACCA